jgi:uncharacterized protein YjbJ (UPF0337 family)
MNENMVSGKWNEIKGEIQQMWGKLTGEELDRTKGNITAIGGLIEQRYGEAKDAVSKKLDTIFNKSGEAIADKSEDVKDAIRDTKIPTDDKDFSGADKH